MSNIGRVGANTVLMDINRWSTEAERTALMDTFLQKGPDKLLSALQKQPIRRLQYRLPTSVGYDLRYTHRGSRA